MLKFKYGLSVSLTLVPVMAISFILSTSLVVVFLRKVKDYIAPIIVVYENICSGVGSQPLYFD